MSTAAASSSADAAPAAADNVTGRGGGGRRRNDQNIARNAALPRPAALVATGAVLAAPNRSPRLPAPLENEEEEEEEVNEYNEEGRFDEMPFNLLPTNPIKLSGANKAAAAGGGDGNGRNLRVSNDHYQRLSPNGPIEVIDLVSDSDPEPDSDSDEGEQNNNNAAVNRLSIAANNSNQRAVSNNNNNGSNNSRNRSSSSNNNNNIRNNGKNVAAKQHRPAAPRTVPSLTSQTVPKTISSATANPRLSTSTSSYFSCSSSSSTSSSSSSEDQSVALGNSGGGGSGGARGRIPKQVAFNSSAATFLTASSSSSLSASKHSAPKRKQKSLSSKGPKTAKVPKRTKAAAAAAARNPTQVTPKFTCSCPVCFKGFKFPSGLSIHLQNNFHCNKTHRERSEAAAAAAAAATTTAAAAASTQVAPPPPPPSSPEPQGPPYICRHCVRDFSRKCSLLEHKRRLHKAPQVSAFHSEDRQVVQEGSQPQPQQQQLQPQPQLQQLQPQPRQECTICRLTFKNSHGLSIHSSKVHRTRRGQQQQQQQKPKNVRVNVVRPKAKSSSNNNIGISTENNVEGNDDDDSDDDDDDDGCDGFIDAITNRSNPGVRLESSAERLKVTSTVKVGDTVGVLYDFRRKRNQVRPVKEPHFVYQAKVLRKEWDVTRERHLFLVHFDGWEGRWDEWITGERLWVSLDWLSGRWRSHDGRRQRDEACHRPLPRKSDHHFNVEYFN